MTDYKRYLVTAALPYANGSVHIGHLAGCYLPADIYVRYLRAKKIDVKFVCGTDEHGVPITIKAIQEKVSPQDIVDRYYPVIRDSFKEMGISFDIFSRTSNPTHHETAASFFKKMYEDGLFEEKETEQYYDEEKNVFLADRYIIGICPVCGNENAYGDQCERCGSSLSPEELLNPRSALSDSAPVKKKTKHWYMPLQNYEDWLKQWVLEEHKDWKNNVYGQCKSWLDNGLQSRAMTRDSNWGVKVPLPDAEGKVLYVWFDAPIGYISATKELTPNWEDYWKKEDTRLIHFIGKDNIVFHCIIFPAMLKAHGGYVLPDNVPANEFLNIEGEKVSTSRNWAVWVEDYLKDFPDQQDVLRYVLCSTAPETKDNDFTWRDFQFRNNSELVAILGNFINRAMVLVHKLCNGKVPPFHLAVKEEQDDQLFLALQQSIKKIEDSLEHFKFREALAEVMNVAREGNKYLQEKAPWIIDKELQAMRKQLQETPDENLEKEAEKRQQQIDNCIHLCLQLTANLAILINPFLPFTAQKICRMLKVVDRMLEWENVGSLKLVRTGYSLRESQLLFRKIEDNEIEEQVLKLNERAKKPSVIGDQSSVNNTANNKSEISFDDFAKLELRIGTITAAEKVKKTDKLLKLAINLGNEERTVVSGIALHYQPESLIGKQVTLVANLAPRKLKGIESQGMILMAEDSEGKLVFVNPDIDIAPGSEVS